MVVLDVFTVVQLGAALVGSLAALHLLELGEILVEVELILDNYHALGELIEGLDDLLVLPDCSGLADGRVARCLLQSAKERLAEICYCGLNL